ncbi:MAG: acyl carrier protein [Ilumatobacteraceae bacterium]
MTEQTPDRDAFVAELITMIERDLSLLPDDPIEHDTELLLDGFVDSLGVMQMVAWLEDRLGLRIEPSDIVYEHFRTVDEIAAFALVRTS